MHSQGCGIEADLTLVRKIYRVWNSSDIRDACRLCLITDGELTNERSLHACTADAVVGGATFVRLRNRHASTLDLVNSARNLAPICRVANIPLVVEGDIEAAKAAGIDGVHLTENDMPCANARIELGKDAIIGVSVSDVQEAIDAEAAGADYLSAGPVYPLGAAGIEDGILVSAALLKDISSAVSIPVLAAGGINASNVEGLSGTGIAGIAVKTAILAPSDIESATRTLSDEVDAYIANTSGDK